MKQSLYNIIEEQRYTLAEIELMEGELTPELEEQLIINAHQLESKSIAYLEVIKTKDAFNMQIAEEIKRLQALKKRNDNLTTRLKENLLIAVKTFGDFEAGFNKFSTRKSSSIEVENINGLPNEFKTIKVTESANKSDLKKAIQSGEIIEGVKLVEHQNLKIN